LGNSKSFDTRTVSYGDLVGNGKVYRVPTFQRDYSWDTEYWEDLWYDILDIEDQSIHYMGYTVHQTNDDKEYLLIDGQQRFATLSILALATIKIIQELAKSGIDEEDNTNRSKLLIQQFVSFQDPASLIPTTKLHLNKNDDGFYKSFILRLRKPQNVQKLKPSKRLMWKAFEFFYAELNKYFKETQADSKGEALATFLMETVAKKLMFTVVTVSDDLSAYKVFETLNARGVKLSPTDLLKNHLFSIVYKTTPSEIEEAERQWQNISNTLGSVDFTIFLRHYWNSYNELVRKKLLFKTIKKNLTISDDVFSLLDKLEQSAPLYTAFKNPSDPIWTSKQSSYIKTLNLFNISQCYSLLFIGFDKMQKNDFTKLLKMCIVISFRYNIVCGLNPNEMETTYNKVAQKIYKEEIVNLPDIFKELAPIYVDDETFKNQFKRKVVTTNGTRWKRLIRYIFSSLEEERGNPPINFDDPSISIEHILPENPSSEWEQQFTPDDQELFLYRLGNYVLLDESKNRDCGDLPFDKKKKIYADSEFKLAQEISRLDHWDKEQLEIQQDKLAKIATHFWRLDYN